MTADMNLETANWTFADLIRDVQVPEKYQGTLRAKQLQIAGKMSILMVIANLMSAAVVMIAFQNEADQLLSLWIYAVATVSAVSFLSHVRNRKLYTQKTRSMQELDRYRRGAWINGIVWSMAPLIVMNISNDGGHMTMAIVLASMLFGGAFLLSRVPDAAVSFMIPVGAGMVIAMQVQQNSTYQLISVITIAYICILMLAVRWSHRQFVEQHISEAAIDEQKQLIGLLLRDFEESSADYLWQTDKDGVLQEIPMILRGDGEKSSFLQKGCVLHALFEQDEAARILDTSLLRRQGFHNLVLKMNMGGETQHWSLTGKAYFDGETFKGFRGVATDITQSKAIEDRIAYLAHFDGLTGLPNRMSLQEALEKSLRRPAGSETERALLWMDLDNFKWVNDTLGHPAGDELLQQVAARLNALATPKDTVARISGDEFALIVERPAGELDLFLDSMTRRLNEPYTVWGTTVNCSASIGVRLFDTFTSDSRMLFKHADLALYQAKKLGKANWCAFTADLDERARARLQIEADLNRALESNELRVYFQPLVDAKTLKLIGCESLLRWQHPKRGLVFPGEFIEHAEDSGLITRMGEWVIRAALSEARRLPEDVRVSVNISPLQIHSTTLLTTIVQAIAANRIDPNRLELEITESVLMNDTEFTLQRLHQLKALGVRIALDDFGTGYSSLSYLRKFPFDKIKIDKSFVTDIESRADSRAITIATLNLAKTLGMRCTAEGVETRYQAEFLRDHGCDELQGFFISKAQPLDRLQHLVTLRDVLGDEPVDPTAKERLERRLAIADSRKTKAG